MDELNFNTFFDFCNSVKGKILYHDRRQMCKADIYWGFKAGRVDKGKIRVIDKPGWENGGIVNYVHYSLWLNETKFG